MGQATSGYSAKSAISWSSNIRRVYILLGLFALCTLFYYFGELIDYAGWKALRWDFFYTVHDIHRLFFLIPIVFAGYFFGVRAVIIITILALATFLYRALFVSTFPDPLMRMIVFIIIGGTIGYLIGNESEQRKRLNTLVKRQRNETLAILEGMEEGVLIIGTDYRIRFMNPIMRSEFGEGIGS